MVPVKNQNSQMILMWFMQEAAAHFWQSTEETKQFGRFDFVPRIVPTSLMVASSQVHCIQNKSTMDAIFFSYSVISLLCSVIVGMALLTAAMLLGYMLARLQFWVLAAFSSKNVLFLQDKQQLYSLIDNVQTKLSINISIFLRMFP